MKKINFFFFSATVFIITSCVPQRKFEDLQASYEACKNDLNDCNKSLKNIKDIDSSQKVMLSTDKAIIDRMRIDSIEINSILYKTKTLYNEINDTYERLLKFNQSENDKISGNIKDLEKKNALTIQELDVKEAELNRLSKQLEQLQNDLKIREEKITKINADLKQRETKVNELQSIINSRDSSTQALKNSLSEALLGYKDAGLEVNVKNGKVYVSLSDQLLFASGSIIVDKKGKEALLKLSEILQKQNDINIQVEGHTDDIPMKGTGEIKDNWDLSVMRATSIIRILTKDGNIDPQRLSAAGRSEYLPIDPAKNSIARKKNRRTEIILTPKLDRLMQLIGNN